MTNSRNTFLTLLILLLSVNQFSTTSIAAEPEKTKTENVLLVTLDGLRWQDLFRGADPSLINPNTGGVKNVPQTEQRFLRETAEEGRAALLPFFWNTISKEGRIYGNRDVGSKVHLTNNRHFSYPGYSEILTGFADPGIDSNDKIPNPNITVLEWLNNKPAYRGKVAAFCSWDVFPFIINDQRSGVYVDAGWDETPEKRTAADFEQLAREVPRYWDNVRYDYFTFRRAESYLKKYQPRVLYVALGETDDWAHAGRYDLYLDSAFRNDDYIRRLWETMQSLDQYKGKTSLIITTDHGRGDDREGWKSHSTKIPGCDEIWIAVMGPDTPAAAGALTGEWTQSQVAATVARLLGENYLAESPQSARPLADAFGK